jgi:hypothetical protein
MESLLKMENRTAPIDLTENAEWRRTKNVTLTALVSLVLGAATALPATAANPAPTDSGLASEAALQGDRSLAHGREIDLPFRRGYGKTNQRDSVAAVRR